MNFASNEYVGRSNTSVQATIALLRRRAAISASAMLANVRNPLCSLRGRHQSARPMSETSQSARSHRRCTRYGSLPLHTVEPSLVGRDARIGALCMPPPSALVAAGEA
jgi:hypothetical protein